jgi:hypothetical protein
MPSMIISGRPAWIGGIVLGVVMIIYGSVTGQTILPIAGGVVLLVCLVFLIISIVTGRRSD